MYHLKCSILLYSKKTHDHFPCCLFNPLRKFKENNRTKKDQNLIIFLSERFFSVILNNRNNVRRSKRSEWNYRKNVKHYFRNSLLFQLVKVLDFMFKKV